MIRSIQARIRRRFLELVFLALTGAALFTPGIPYPSYVMAAIPVVAWLMLDRLGRLAAEVMRLRRLKTPYLLKTRLEEW